MLFYSLRPENNPLGRQMSRYHFQELKERYLEMEQVHLNNICILEAILDTLPKLKRNLGRQHQYSEEHPGAET